MAAEHWSILLKKHFVWTDTMGLSDNVISQQKAAMDRVKWESKEQSPQQRAPNPPSHHPNTAFKKENNTPKQTLLVHIGANKLETNKSKWTLSHSTFCFPQSMFPDGNSFPSLPKRIGGRGGAASSRLYSYGPKWTLRSEWNLRVEGCPLGPPGSINISKDNHWKLERVAETNKQRICFSD